MHRFLRRMAGPTWRYPTVAEHKDGTPAGHPGQRPIPADRQNAPFRQSRLLRRKQGVRRFDL